jgi:DNA (cytosine-5)-methyltransferase 1
MPKTHLKAVDFFCSGGGMTCGLSQAGIKVIAGIDNDPTCKETYERNNRGAKFILADIFSLKEKDVQETLSLKINDDDLVLIGCSPCQFWSIIRTDKTKSANSKYLLLEFERFVNYFNPGYVLVENVPGILAKKDRSGLDLFITNLKDRGYEVHYEIVNMNDYGVPQNRRRFSLLASRLQKKPVFPKVSEGDGPTVADVLGVKNGFHKIEAGHQDQTPFYHTTARLTKINLLRLKKTPRNGGSWLSWSKDKKLKRKLYSGIGFIDNYGRMKWEKPAPTITTKFVSVSNGRFAHPDENRGISIREGATLQTFPMDYIFHCDSITIAARIIGNAVPPRFARLLGKTIVNSHNSRHKI